VGGNIELCVSCSPELLLPGIEFGWRRGWGLRMGAGMN
jgi:hypothetical protein